MLFKRIVCVLALTLLLLMSSMLVPYVNTTEKASAGVARRVSVTISGSDTVYAGVGPGEAAFASLKFTVTNNGIAPFEQIEMSVQYGAGATSVIVSPNRFTLTRSTPQTVVAYIGVDRSVEAPTFIPVTVTATIIGDPTATAGSAGGTVIIKQFPFIVVNPDTPYKEIPPGTPFSFSFKIENKGNGQTPVRFEVVNEADLKGKGWTITLPPSQILSVKQTVTVSISGSTPRAWGWRSEFESVRFAVIVKDLQDTESKKAVNYTQDYSVTIFLRGFFIPAFDPMFSIISIGVVAAVLGNRRKIGLKQDEMQEEPGAEPLDAVPGVSEETVKADDGFGPRTQ